MRMSAVCCTLPSSLAVPALGYSGRSRDNGLMHASQYEASLYCNMGSVPVADLPECGMRSAGTQMQMMPAKDCWQPSNGGCVTTHADCSISASTAYHSTRKAGSSSQSWILQQQQQHHQPATSSVTTGKFVVPNAPRALRRVPVSSAGRVSHRMVPNLHTSTAPVRRALCVDPNKDYSTALHVDCSIEYDLPRVARPPPGAQPLLLIAKPSRPSLTPSATYHRPRQPLRHDLMLRTVTNLYDNAASAKSSSTTHQQQQHEMTPSWWSYGSINNSSEMTPTSQTRFELSTMDHLPLATCSSADSGRGTDSERSPGISSSYSFQQPMPWSHIPAPVDSGLGLDPCFNFSGKQLRSFEPVHQSAFDNFRTEVHDLGQQCHCCQRPQQEGATRAAAAVAPVTMSAAFRWTPYSTQLRYVCPTSNSQQLQQHRNARSKQLYVHQQHQPQQQQQCRSSLMAFHV